MAGINAEQFRKFLCKNQGSRFSERTQTKLFQTVQFYFVKFDRQRVVVKAAGTNISICELSNYEKSSALDLIEDALKRPCFNTPQKKAMLKWLDEIHGKSEQSARGLAQDTSSTNKYDWDAQLASEFDDDDYDTSDHEDLSGVAT